MTPDEQVQMLVAIRAGLRSTLGAVECLLRTLGAEPGGGPEGDDHGDNGDDPQERSALEWVAGALADAVAALRQPARPVRQLPVFPMTLQQLRDLVERYGGEAGQA